MPTALPRLMLTEIFRYRRCRGCTRADVACVAWAMRLRAELTSIEAAVIEELLYTLAHERQGQVRVEVLGT